MVYNPVSKQVQLGCSSKHEVGSYHAVLPSQFGKTHRFDSRATLGE
jgi:hypothetical protein